MKKYIIIILTMLVAIQPVAADSLIILEALVQSHKSLSNKLRDRTTVETSVMGSTTLTTNKTGNYEEILEDMHTRYSGSLSNIHFAADVASLTTLAVKTIRACENSIDRTIDLAAKYPVLLVFGTKALDYTGMQITGIYQLLAMVVTGGTGVVLASNEDRAQFCFMVRTKLMNIQAVMRELMGLCNHWESFGGLNLEEQNIDVLLGSKMKDAFDRALMTLAKAESKL